MKVSSIFRSIAVQGWVTSADETQTRNFLLRFMYSVRFYRVELDRELSYLRAIVYFSDLLQCELVILQIVRLKSSERDSVQKGILKKNICCPTSFVTRVW